MAVQCCICNNKIGIFDNGRSLIPGNDDYQICQSCNENLEKIEVPEKPDTSPTAKHAQNVALSAITNYLIKDDLNPEVRRLLVEEIIHSDFRTRFLNEEQEQRNAQEQQEEAERRFTENVDEILTTTGFNFEGYRITEYHGVFAGNYVVGVGVPASLMAEVADLSGSRSGSIANNIKSAGYSARRDLIKQCIMAGGNAIIGIAYNVYPYGSMLGVTISGTSVTIEKE